MPERTRWPKAERAHKEPQGLLKARAWQAVCHRSVSTYMAPIPQSGPFYRRPIKKPCDLPHFSMKALGKNTGDNREAFLQRSRIYGPVQQPQ